MTTPQHPTRRHRPRTREEADIRVTKARVHLDTAKKLVTQAQEDYRAALVLLGEFPAPSVRVRVG